MVKSNRRSPPNAVRAKNLGLALLLSVKANGKDNSSNSSTKEQREYTRCETLHKYFPCYQYLILN